MGAIDTNVLVRLFIRDNPNQTASAEAFIKNGVWVSVLVLAETVWVLETVYGFDWKELTTAIEMLANEREVILQDADAVAAALDLFRAKPSLGFADCLILTLARKAGHLPLGTFDRNVGKVAGAQKL